MKLGKIFRLCSISNYATMLTLGLNRFFIGVNEYDSYEMLTFASWKQRFANVGTYGAAQGSA